jgi:hypothetical protein
MKSNAMSVIRHFIRSALFTYLSQARAEMSGQGERCFEVIALDVSLGSIRDRVEAAVGPAMSLCPEVPYVPKRKEAVYPAIAKLRCPISITSPRRVGRSLEGGRMIAIWNADGTRL